MLLSEGPEQGLGVLRKHCHIATEQRVGEMNKEHLFLCPETASAG